MNKKLCLLIAVCCIFFFGFSVFAQVSVGLNHGDWVEYEVTYTGTPPESYPENVRIEVQTIQGTNITVEIERTLLNRTQDSKTVTFDLESGAFDLIIIPANLGAGDAVCHEDFGNFTIEGVVVYYFGDDIGTAEDYTLELPIRVRSAGVHPPPTTPVSHDNNTGIFGLPGWRAVFVMIGLLIVAILLRVKRGKQDGHD